MGPSALEVADIFRAHGPAFRLAQRSHLSLGQLKVMTAIEQCRTAALGGHVLRCPDCQRDQVSYNSCRNRHCPKCRSIAAKRWLQARQADLLPVDYYHVVFTLPAPISDISYCNKAVVYGLLFEIAAETLTTIAADPKHLGAEVGVTLVLHTWGSAANPPPPVPRGLPGGGLSPDGKRWVSCSLGSSCRCECSPVCSGASSWRRWRKRTARASCSSLVTVQGWPIPNPLRSG